MRKPVGRSDVEFLPARHRSSSARGTENGSPIVLKNQSQSLEHFGSRGEHDNGEKGPVVFQPAPFPAQKTE